MLDKALSQLSDNEKLELIRHLQAEIRKLEVIYPSHYGLTITMDTAVDEVIRNLPILLFVSDIAGTITEIQGHEIGHVITQEQIETALGKSIGKVFPNMPAIKYDAMVALQGTAIQNTVELGAALFRAYYQPIHAGDAITGVVTVLTDIRQMAQREANYNDSEIRLRAIFEQTQQFMCLLGTDGKIIEVNRTALDFAGLERCAVLGKNIWEMAWWGNGVEAQTLALAVKQCSQGNVIEYETEMHGKDKQVVTIDLRLKPIMNPANETTMILAEGHNVKERKAAEEKEKELSNLKSRFITFTSHEFRNPLAVIASSAYLLRKQGADTPDEIRDRHLDKIERNVTHIATMLDDIFLLGNLRAKQMGSNYTAYPVSQMTGLIIKDYEQHYGQTHTFNLHSNPPNIEIQADQLLWEKALNQLLKNAVLYTRDSGIINICLSLEGDMFIMRIQDNGVGILPEESTHIFESFVRGSNVDVFPGTGLGLAIVQDVVNLHQGTITVESEAGNTIFTVRVPRNAE